MGPKVTTRRRKKSHENRFVGLPLDFSLVQLVAISKEKENILFLAPLDL